MRIPEVIKINNAILAAYEVPRSKIDAETKAMCEKFIAYHDDKSVFNSNDEFSHTMITFFVLNRRREAEPLAETVEEAAA